MEWARFNSLNHSVRATELTVHICSLQAHMLSSPSYARVELRVRMPHLACLFLQNQIHGETDWLWISTFHFEPQGIRDVENTHLKTSISQHEQKHIPTGFKKKDSYKDHRRSALIRALWRCYKSTTTQLEYGCLLQLSWSNTQNKAQLYSARLTHSGKQLHNNQFNHSGKVDTQQHKAHW